MEDQYSQYENMYDMNNHFDVANFNESNNNQFTQENNNPPPATGAGFRPLDRSVKEHLIGLKEAVIDTPKDIYHKGLTGDLFNAERLFYLGFVLVVIGIIGYLIMRPRKASKK